MYFEYEKKLINKFNSFIEGRIMLKEVNYEEMLWQIRLLALAGDLLEDLKEIRLEKYLLFIKNEIQMKYKRGELNIRFIYDTGEALHYINSEICSIEKFLKSYNELVDWWIEKYINQIGKLEYERINLSYENGLCCLIRYCLLDKIFFGSHIKDLFCILKKNIEIYLKYNDIDLGMSYGVTGWLNVINQTSKEDYMLEECAKILLEIYKKEKIINGDLLKWPAIVKKSGNNLYTVSDNWSYGSSMILYNLLNSRFLGDLEKDYYYRELIYNSYQPIGDLGVTNCSFYSGYAGCLDIYTKCFEKYKEPSFKKMRNEIAKVIIESKMNNGLFIFYRYENSNNHLIRIEDNTPNLIENYRIYKSLCAVIDKK